MKARLIRLGEEAVQISLAGHYRAPSGRHVAIGETPYGEMFDSNVLPGVARFEETLVEVTTESTLSALRRLGPGAVALNFASAKNPGGGFLRGAIAQEESLARSSTLYATLQGQRFYSLHTAGGFYSDAMIYSPKVTVFRDDGGALLEEPYVASFITAAAVNVGAIQPTDFYFVESTMLLRAERVLALASAKRHEKLVLGAWGCGVFRNSPVMVASIFKKLLDTTYKGHFRHIVHPIYGGGQAWADFSRVFT
jgi:uncharacterized protein (TIGR02452 family)